MSAERQRPSRITIFAYYVRFYPEFFQDTPLYRNQWEVFPDKRGIGVRTCNFPPPLSLVGSELFPGTQTAKDLYVIAIVFELAHDLFH